MARKTIVILGAGGMAREIEWLIRDINRVEERYQFIGYTVTDISQLGPHDDRDRLLGDYDWLARNIAGVDAVAVGVGTPALRLTLVSEVNRILPSVEWPTLIHPSALIDIDSAHIGRGVQICAGVIGTINVTLEAYSLCNLGCSLGHEATVGEGSVINPGANISGGVSIGKSALVGTGAQVLQYLKIGDNSVVGGGAVVTRNVPDNITVVGVPAKAITCNSLPKVRIVERNGQ